MHQECAKPSLDSGFFTRVYANGFLPRGCIRFPISEMSATLRRPFSALGKDNIARMFKCCWSFMLEVFRQKATKCRLEACKYDIATFRNTTNHHKSLKQHSLEILSWPPSEA